ncbi:alpha/beta hydrolase fold domain-containing protein [Geojedonia litorea]|uniref:Alpha/beta hydrolase fold domain-containing protein n=1 Tax=Geojedonia litorea TaxID=1268269 RepID=A0ABV9MY94_9FLAO
MSDKSTEQIAATYTIIKDVAYGTDAEQAMDIYLSKDAKSYGKHNYTVVFLHGGAYYVSDKSAEERYIEPYLKKGLNVINMNYRLKKGIPTATSDLTNALNFLKANNKTYNLNLDAIIVTGFSAGAHMATIVGVSQNNPEFPHPLHEGITIAGIINFAGPVDGLDVIEKIFVDHDNELWSKAGKALFASEGYELKERIAIYEPITYLDSSDPPIFLWHGGNDNQIPPETFKNFVPKLNRTKDMVVFLPNAYHSPSAEELKNAYVDLFRFLDQL